VKLFDNIGRTDASPRRYSESTFQFLSRSARPAVERIRHLLEAWFAEYPDDQKLKLKNDFSSPEYSKHLGAWWELYVFTLYRTLGYGVEVHPSVPGSPNQPDFLVSNTEISFYIECTAVSPTDHSGRPNLKGKHWIQDCINAVQNPNFYVGLRIKQFGTQHPRQTDITRRLSAWLSTLDDTLPAELVPPLDLQAKDWELTVMAYPIPPDKRDGTGRLLGILPPAGAFFINDVEVLHKALRDKGGRYGRRLDKPLVVALSSTSGFTEDDDITDAVFARKAIQYTTPKAYQIQLKQCGSGTDTGAPGHPFGVHVSQESFSASD
jgi:hypothetical protein